MRLYPDTADDRGRAVAKDALVILTLIVLAWLGLKVHDTVDKLAVLGAGVHDSGQVMQDGFDRAADAVDGVPIIGGDLGGALHDAGKGTGGNVAQAGADGEQRVHDLANLLGFLMFAVPASILLVLTVPGRVRQVRELNAIGRLLDISNEDRRQLVAMRAAFTLPATALARHTRDPMGDLAVGHYDPLIDAAYDEAGLRRRTA
ncbi:MAG: hypothetical protein ABW142_00330 [Thermoleophilaceae bacterium]